MQSEWRVGWLGGLAVAALVAAGGVLQARRILARINAGVVVGFGGYPSVAPVLATCLMRPRPAVILHEQRRVDARQMRGAPAWPGR